MNKDSCYLFLLPPTCEKIMFLIKFNNLRLFILIITLFLTACGGGGGNSNISLPNTNKPPSAVIESNTNVDAQTLVVLDGSKSQDADGTITQYKWTQTAGTTVALNNANTAKASFTSPASESDEVLSFKLTVIDNLEASNTATIQIKVKAINKIPVANAGIEQTVQSGNNVVLDGSASSDADGTIAQYKWTQIAGTTVALTNANTAKASFTLPADIAEQTLSFSLTVTDNAGAAVTGKVDVYIKNNFTLNIEKFGKGSFTANGLTIDCKIDNSCSYDFPAKTVITIHATPDMNWSLNNWLGCNTQQDNDCTITLDEDKTIYPTFTNNNVSINKNAKVLTSNDFLKITQVKDNNILAQNDFKSDLMIGDILISQEGYGFARKVVSISNQNGLKNIETVNASLEEVIEEGSIVFNKELTLADVASITPANPAFKLSLKKASTSNQKDVLSIDLSEGSSKLQSKILSIQGSLTFSLTPDFGINIIHNEIQEFKSVLIANTNFDLTGEISLSSSKSLINENHSIKIATFKFNPLTTLVGVLPIVIVPEEDVYLVANFSADGKIKYNITSSLKTQSGIGYYKNIGWRPIFSSEKKFEVANPTIEANANLGVGAKLLTNLLVYDQFGPAIGLTLEGILESKFTASPEEKKCKLSAQLSAKLSASASLEASGFLKQILDTSKVDSNIEMNLFSLKQKLKDLFEVSCRDEDAPTIPLNLKVGQEFATSVTLLWELSEDKAKTGLVDGYKIYRDGIDIATVHTNFYHNKGLEPSTTYCYNVSAIDNANPANESERSIPVCATTKALNTPTPNPNPDPNYPPCPPMPNSCNTSTFDANQCAIDMDIRLHKIIDSGLYAPNCT